MIESRVKNVLQGLSMVTVLILGGYSLYHFGDALKLRAEAQEWKQTNGSWYAAKCENDLPSEMITRLICQEAWTRKAYYESAPKRAMAEAVTALGLAVAAPLLLLLWELRLRLQRSRE